MTCEIEGSTSFGSRFENLWLSKPRKKILLFTVLCGVDGIGGVGRGGRFARDREGVREEVE